VNQIELILTLPSRKCCAFSRKNADYDGVYFVAVKTTGIFCRPSCPSRPKPENVEFFGSIKDCLFAGYRPCKRCRPLEANGAPPDWVARLIAHVQARPDSQIKARDLHQWGVTPERARRRFQQNYGMTFTAWCRGHRLAGAFTQLRNGGQLDDAVFNSGFESHSGFRDAFNRTFGSPPGRLRQTGQHVVCAIIESPLGPLLAGATDEACLLEYTDRRMSANLTTQSASPRGRSGRPQWLTQLPRTGGILRWQPR
jgi:AraC family transcriptional regulator of adaptative response/methylated-DNA-[protein]-cysteine methyltransferase